MNMILNTSRFSLPGPTLQKFGEDFAFFEYWAPPPAKRDARTGYNTWFDIGIRAKSLLVQEKKQSNNPADKGLRIEWEGSGKNTTDGFFRVYVPSEEEQRNPSIRGLRPTAEEDILPSTEGQSPSEREMYYLDRFKALFKQELMANGWNDEGKLNHKLSITT